MDIHIIKRQEIQSGKRFFGRDKLILEISVTLSEEEKSLIKEYYDPQIKQFVGPTYESIIHAIQTYYDGSVEEFQKVKIEQLKAPLSEFHLIAYVDNLYLLGNLQAFEQAVIKALSRSIQYLKMLKNWQGSYTINLADVTPNV